MTPEDVAVIKGFLNDDRKHWRLMLERKRTEIRFIELKLKSVTECLEHYEKLCCSPIQQQYSDLLYKNNTDTDTAGNPAKKTAQNH